MPKAKLGGKITDSHTTVTEAATVILNAAQELVEVTKISIGLIKHIGGGGEKRLKFLPATGGIKVVVRGSGAVQELFIYTKNPADTETKLLEVFNNS